jgi:hypothetical protein
MKKIMVSAILMLAFLTVRCFTASAQVYAIPGTPLPEDINKILTFSCTPCHTSQGGLMSKSKLNLTEWINYSAEKQKEKAAKMYSEVSKGAMPPKKARELKPETIPTKEQIELIKKWSESFPAETK